MDRIVAVVSLAMLLCASSLWAQGMGPLVPPFSRSAFQPVQQPAAVRPAAVRIAQRQAAKPAGRYAVEGAQPAPGRGQEADAPLPALRLGVHPFLSEFHLRKRFMPLVDYLSEALRRPVELVVSEDYRSHISQVGEGRLDLAYLGPAPYVRLVEAYGPRPLIARQAVLGTPLFNGVIITRSDSRITTLSDLKGKRFAFGDPSSTMSHLMPRYMLREAGVSVDELAEYAFVGSHDKVAVAVLRRQYDAGAVKQAVFSRLRHRGLRELALSPLISEHLFVAREGLPPALIEQLRELVLQLDQSVAGRAVLSAIKPTVTAMVPVQDSDYDSLREVIETMREAGVDL